MVEAVGVVDRRGEEKLHAVVQQELLVQLFRTAARKVQQGKVANSMSVMLDPTAIRRKIAIEQMNRDLQGSGGSTTTKR